MGFEKNQKKETDIMKNRKWTNQQKMQIVLEGLKSQMPIGELCNKYEISQGQYYKWRDVVLNSADNVFVPDPDKEKARMRQKIDKLNQTIGELTVELKKTEELL
jgi:transposase-like protein